MRVSNSATLSSFLTPKAFVCVILLSLVMILGLIPAAHALLIPSRTYCPANNGGTLMPPGATYTDLYGNTWVAPSGSEGGGTALDTFGVWASYFFPGPQTSYPLPMQEGFGGMYGTYDGQQGWIITDFCQTIVAPV